MLTFIYLPFSPVFQTCAPYTIAGLTITVYSSLVLIIHRPQVVAATHERALKAAVPFPAVIFVCSFQFILGSSHTPSTPQTSCPVMGERNSKAANLAV